MSTTSIQRLGIATFGSISLITAYLGKWQIDRYNWKTNLIEKRKKQLNGNPIPLHESQSALQKGQDSNGRLDYEYVYCKGSFDYENSITVGPRSVPKGSSKDVGCISKSGLLVITPFKDKVTGKKYLVNRGWIDRNNRDEMFQKETDEFIEFEGIISPPELGGKFTPTYDSKLKQFYALNPKEISRIIPVDNNNFSIERVNHDESIVSRSISSFLEFKVIPETHITYAITWFSISLFCLYIVKRKFWIKSIIRK